MPVSARSRPLTDWPIRDISADTLERFKEARLVNKQGGRGRVAVNRNLMLLRSCFNWAIVPGGYLTATPFKIGPVTAVHLFPELARERRLEPGEEARLLPACGPHLRALVEAALETVCRIGELLSLQWRQVRWAQNEIHLPGAKTKAKKPRYMPISQRLHAILEMRRLDPDGQPHRPDAYVFGNALGERAHYATVSDAWVRACKRAEITGLHFHDLRREAASRLLEGDVPEQYVQAVLGHADLSTTSKYLATTRKGLHQVMQRYEARVQTRVNFSEARGRQRLWSLTARLQKTGSDVNCRGEQMSVRHVGVQEAHQLQTTDGYTYVDVRSVPEYENGHPEGAHNVPLLHFDSQTGQMTPNPDFLAVMQANYPTDAKLLLGCQVGGRSARAVQILGAAGYDTAVNVRGWFGGSRDPATGHVVDDGWAQMGLPVENGSPEDVGYDALRQKVGGSSDVTG